MERLILIFEIIGTISFALTGAMTGLKKQMDIFGVCVLGVTTAVGGGIIRDLILGLTPPSAFRDPTSVLIAIAVSIMVFLTAVRRLFRLQHRVLLLLSFCKLLFENVDRVQITVKSFTYNRGNADGSYIAYLPELFAHVHFCNVNFNGF